MALCTKTGKDNHGRPVTEFIENLKNLTEEKLFEECRKYIWLSAYAGNNPRSDYHWMCDATYDECDRRNKKEIYERAHQAEVRAAQ